MQQNEESTSEPPAELPRRSTVDELLDKNVLQYTDEDLAILIPYYRANAKLWTKKSDVDNTPGIEVDI